MFGKEDNWTKLAGNGFSDRVEGNSSSSNVTGGSSIYRAFLVFNELTFFVGVLRGRDEDILEILVKHDVLMDLFLPLTANCAVKEDRQDPEHAQQNADSAAQDKCNGPTLPWPEGSQGFADTPEEALDTLMAPELAQLLVFVAMLLVRMVGSLHRSIAGPVSEIFNLGMVTVNKGLRSVYDGKSHMDLFVVMGFPDDTGDE